MFSDSSAEADPFSLPPSRSLHPPPSPFLSPFVAHHWRYRGSLSLRASFPFQQDGFHSVQARKALLWRYSATLTFVFFFVLFFLNRRVERQQRRKAGERDLWLRSRWRATQRCQVQKASNVTAKCVAIVRRIIVTCTKLN